MVVLLHTRWYAFLSAAVACAATLAVPIGQSQVLRPESLDASPGVHIHVYDGKVHRPVDHYSSLCRIVLTEFGLPSDSLPGINLVFIDEDVRQQIITNNATRFQSADWYGVFIAPSLILISGEQESDDTFMHEYMHFLQQRGLLFKNVPMSAVHHLIEQNEGLLLGSKGYLEYLKTRPK